VERASSGFWALVGKTDLDWIVLVFCAVVMIVGVWYVVRCFKDGI
jgi:hypothetical protein